jgi:hypothetical protein
VVFILSKRLEELRKHVDNLSEEQVRDYLTEVLASIQAIGFGGYTEEEALKDIKRVYMDIAVRPVMNKVWSKINNE